MATRTGLTLSQEAFLVLPQAIQAPSARQAGRSSIATSSNSSTLLPTAGVAVAAAAVTAAGARRKTSRLARRATGSASERRGAEPVTARAAVTDQLVTSVDPSLGPQGTCAGRVMQTLQNWRLGVHKFNPMLFALIRECCAGPILLALAVAFDGRVVPYRGDWPLIFVMGLCVVMNQALFIIGDKLAGPIISSAWQCSQPIMALMISVALGWEKITNGKLSGILLSVVGGGFLVCYGQSLQSSEAIGNLLLAVNCLATALYVIFSKIALQRYPPLTITAWAAMVACVIMAVVATSVNSHCGFVNFVCPEDPNEAMFRCHSYRNSCAPWAVPDTAILPLAYWIGCTSITGHFLITWANRHARAGYILAYAAIQPFTSTMVTVILILCGVHGLKMPGWNALGIVGILMGLFLLVLDGKKQHEADEELCDSRCL